MKKLICALLALVPMAASAQEGLDSGDTAWIMTSTALVLFMSLPGLALFYGGLVRAKNVLSVLMQCFAIVCVVSVIWLVCGYSLAFAPGNGFIGGLSKAFFQGVTEGSMSGSIPETAFAMFQLTFAAITPALVVGGFAERMKFSAMLLFSVLWLLAVYLPVCHWVWAADGWLFKRGLLDFAGGTVVHITAGVAALVAAVVLGSRRGFMHTPMMPHNMTMTVTGAGMLWVGWFGFNGGSALTAGGNATMAILVTHLSAAAGAMMWSAIEWVKYGKPSALGIVTGMVAGLGTITPASGFVGPGGALVIGLAAGFVCFFATHGLKRVLKIDDSLDVFPVHGVGGMLGTFAAGIFASSSLGVFSGQGYAEGMDMGSQLGVQLLGIGATIAYTAVLTWGLLKLVGVLTGLRVNDEEETVGLDTTQHNERGYDLQTL
ncbi:ammonium transporter [Solimonas sp. SE-A11]|uniref:ammonium transporter n=1 Tax=Solimonas sp. SE-A11 TaxID=3054954 RepID=UPI00259CFBE3|nr:ammonium transporter [Solimonas sp. SE-A11]MDM4772693.1 ammonium transporter [Solimonas sp. SE-A11]